MGEETWSFHAPSGYTTLQHLHVFTLPEALWTASCVVSMETLLRRHDWLNHWSLVINSTSRPFSLSRRWGEVEPKIITLYSQGCFPWKLAPIMWLNGVFPKIAPLTWTQVWLKGVCYEYHTHFSIIHLELFQELGTKLNTITKDAPMTCTT